MSDHTIIIRGYRPDDAEQVRGICIETAGEPFNSARMRPLLLNAFCNYYIEQEPSNCFVAADEDGMVAGYILCAENAARWSELFRKEYIEREIREEVRKFLASTCETPLQFMQEYPAHLHIDLSPRYQRSGIGTRLVDALEQNLKAKSVPGLMLSVSNDNEKGIRFYKKNGFCELAVHEHEMVMGKRL